MRTRDRRDDCATATRSRAARAAPRRRRRRRGRRADPRRRHRRSRASRRSTSRRSPASRRPSSARPAATARAVTGGTRVLSDRIVVEITQEPGQSFLDRMIALVEGAERRKTPERDRARHPARRPDADLPRGRRHAAAVRRLRGHRRLDHDADRAARRADPDDDRRAAVARSASPAWTASCAATCSRCRAARSRPPATSTCCCSTRPARSRSATARRPRSSRCPASTEAELAEAAQLASLADETPEGRSIVVLAKQYGIREHELGRSERALRPVHRADAHERRRLQRHAPAQGRRRRDHALGRATRAARRPPELRGRARPHRAARAPRRSPSPATARCSA